MKARLLVAGVGTVFLLVVLLVLPSVATMILTAALALVAAHELLHTVCPHLPGRLMVYTLLAAVLVPVWCFFSRAPFVLACGAFVFALLLFIELIVRYERERSVPLSHALTVLFAGLALKKIFL